MRTEKEILAMIENIETSYPNIENEAIGYNPMRAYHFGVYAGLKSALGEYESFAELDLEEFMRSTFNQFEALSIINGGNRTEETS